MTIQLAVFDIAGTTVQDKGVVNKAFADAFSFVGLTDIDPVEIDEIMGYRKQDAIAIILDRHLVDYEGNRADIIANIYELFTNTLIKQYRSDAEVKALPFAEQAFSLLDEKGIKVCLNTGFGREITDVLLDRLGWVGHPHIHAVICSDEVQEGRPHPYMIGELMKRFEITDSTAVIKIGDTTVDIEEGRNAGCGLVISVTTGAQDRETLAALDPDFVIDSLQELPAIIEQVPC